MKRTKKLVYLMIMFVKKIREKLLITSFKEGINIGTHSVHELF